jgi:monothiol glutaredoxin
MINDDLRRRIEDTIRKDRVMLFMKGVPSMPQCGFSAAVVGVLKEIGVPFGSHNILADPELREGLKEYASWPTYPQLYVDGKLVGGCDIVRAMHARGELAPLLARQGDSDGKGAA